MSESDSLPDLVPAQNQIHIENDPLDKAIRSLNDASDALRQAAADLKKNNKYENNYKTHPNNYLEISPGHNKKFLIASRKNQRCI